MTLSEIFYEAACNMSDGIGPDVSCHAIGALTGSFHSPERYKYEQLMRPRKNDGGWCFDVDDAAAELGWGEREFRTFMLLMASEAVK